MELDSKIREVFMAKPEPKPSAPSTADTILAIAELLRGGKS